MFTSIAIHDPAANEVEMIDHQDLPVGIRFGVGTGGQAVLLHLAAPSHQHENQFMQTIGACDQLIEMLNVIRGAALTRMAELRPDEQIVGVISEASEVPGWNGAGADVEAQRG